jgi:hypothetical protein
MSPTKVSVAGAPLCMKHWYAEWPTPDLAALSRQRGRRLADGGFVSPRVDEESLRHWEFS